MPTKRRNAAKLAAMGRKAGPHSGKRRPFMDEEDDILTGEMEMSNDKFELNETEEAIMLNLMARSGKVGLEAGALEALGAIYEGSMLFLGTDETLPGELEEIRRRVAKRSIAMAFAMQEML